MFEFSLLKQVFHNYGISTNNETKTDDDKYDYKTHKYNSKRGVYVKSLNKSN